MTTVPTLTVNLGDPVAGVGRRAGLEFTRPEVLDFELHIVQEPCQVSFAHPKHPFTLPRRASSRWS